jgi:hypothetical protein
MKIHKRHPIVLHIKSVAVSPLHYLSSWRHFFAHGTQKKRWSNLDNYDVAWDERTALMATMVEKNSSVLEFGAGRERLRDFLPEGCTYQPSDITTRSENTIVCDLNEGFPALQQFYDYIALSGVTEYIYDLDTLFQHVRKHCRFLVVSYSSTDHLECISTRVRQGWVSHLSEEMFLEIIKKANFAIADQKMWRNQVIYRLQ